MKAKPTTAVKLYATGAQVKVKPSEIKAAIRDIFDQSLKGKTFTTEDHKIKTIADNIREKVVKLFKNNRYKIIVHVTLGQRSNQGVRSGTRCLWDAKNDNCVSEVFVNDSLFCQATVYAIYLY